MGGNPQTGPFYVEGAEPGDTLEVTIDRLTPNRDMGYTAVVIAETLFDPPAVRGLPPNGTLVWAIDREARTVSPRRADGAWEGQIDPPATVAGLVVPLAPMVGCFGVAPEGGQAISTATSGPHGGNMDYRGFGPGVTVQFPVAVPGALFHIGDGHAVQGDGEIVGTGVETSFDVEFTCRVRKGRRIFWPRGEDREFIFAVGNARPLDQAVQHATTEMVRWLSEDYGLDTRAASILMGQTVRYEIGNVFDPAYTIVCKMPKAVLTALRS